MTINGEREYELLKKIGFIRLAGSEEEFSAAKILAQEAESAGVFAAIEAFDITDAIVEKAELEVLEPYRKKYEVTAYKCSQNTSDEGLTADFIYVDNALEADLANAKGKIVLVNGFMRLPVFRRLLKAEVAGFVTMSGTLLDKEEETDLFTRKIRQTLESFGNMPAVNLRISDAFELVTKQASRVKMTVKNEKVTLTSHNVIATIEGKKYPNEIISFGAHYDSVPFSTGVYDNGAGSVINMELLRHFKENPPDRTIKFIWYGSEEIGLEGSKAYTKMHSEEIKNHLLMINVDVAGPVLGYDVCKIMGEKSFVDFSDYFMKMNGYAVQVSQSIYSSDSVPFTDAGVPSVNFCRDGAEGGAFIHCRYDVIEYLSPQALAKTTAHILHYSESLINSVVFPVERVIPSETMAEIEKYLYKKELAELETK